MDIIHEIMSADLRHHDTNRKIMELVGMHLHKFIKYDSGYSIYVFNHDMYGEISFISDITLVHLYIYR